jgi:hypothetical protein
MKLKKPMPRVVRLSPMSAEELRQPSSEIKPKYITFERLEAEYGITKGRAYPLIHDGRIKVVRLIEQGRSRGKVLILADTVDRYLKSLEAVEA